MVKGSNPFTLTIIYILRKPNNIILDFNNKNNNNTYNNWAVNFLDNSKINFKFDNNYSLIQTPINFFMEKNYNLINGVNLNFLKKKKSFLNTLYKNFYKKDSYNNINFWYNSININFLRKERLYTKLKYSRSPAFDTVSGGVAALFGGLIVFLVAEKFGIELVDSGDFYFLFMYVVFLSFFLRPYLTVMNYKYSFLEAISLRNVIKFYLNLITLALKFFK